MMKRHWGDFYRTKCKQKGKMKKLTASTKINLVFEAVHHCAVKQEEEEEENKAIELSQVTKKQEQIPIN